MPVDFICGPSTSEFSPNILAYWYLVIYIYICVCVLMPVSGLSVLRDGMFVCFCIIYFFVSVNSDSWKSHTK